MNDERQRAIATWAHHEASLFALRKALDALDGAQVPALVVKGMVLAYELYDDVAKRPMADVDIRVRSADFVRAFRSLRSRGWKPDFTSKQLGAVGFSLDGVLVEVESSVGPPGMCALTVADMLTRSEEQVLPGGPRVRVPELHDHAVVLVVNAFKDKMVDCPTWSIDDLETLAGRADMTSLLGSVQRARVQTITWLVADWMARERRSEVWREVGRRIGAHAPRPAYAWAVRKLQQRGNTSAMLRGLTRMGSDSRGQRAWSVAAGGLGAAVSWLGRSL